MNPSDIFPFAASFFIYSLNTTSMVHEVHKQIHANYMYIPELAGQEYINYLKDRALCDQFFFIFAWC
jgi:hypothetical protein